MSLEAKSISDIDAFPTVKTNVENITEAPSTTTHFPDLAQARPQVEVKIQRGNNKTTGTE
ncbi:hypothetical protein DPMN_186771 [Dreissena polymorpha]|uniref:Uncharacterized protein n=1 Tax=Dreissena polymorpha TaxID=45954 RepID=A0A9D4DMT2_DREPO|nr:hypothetical protein DPMN_186771 [Dreissena polymorpha]